MPIVDLERALGDAERLLFDSSCLIAFHNVHEAAHSLAQHLLRRIERNDDPLWGYISVVIVTELLIRPIRTSQIDFRYMHDFLTDYPNLTVLSADTILAVEAARNLSIGLRHVVRGITDAFPRTRSEGRSSAWAG